MIVGATGNVGTPERVAADIASSDLMALFRGADAVMHLAWLIQPGRDGSERLFEAVAEANVPVLVCASSVGAYSPGPTRFSVDLVTYVMHKST